MFLYYAAHIVHRPYLVPDSYFRKFDYIDEPFRQIYHTMVNYLDDVVGDIVAALKVKVFGTTFSLLSVVTMVDH